MTLYGYPQPGKEKSQLLLSAFVAGARGFLSNASASLHPGASAFYGTVGLEALFARARAAGPWYYLDNAYFDRGRHRFFRISRNALQAPGRTPAPGRLAALGLEIRPPRAGGAHIVVVEQSDYHMRELGGWPGGLEAWRARVLETLARHTDRPIRIRPWARDKLKAGRTLPDDLEGAWAVIAHQSAAANEALLAGVPAFVTGECAAAELANRDLARIENPILPDERRHAWAARLAASQWTLDEMRDGTAWRALQAQTQEQPEELVQ